MAPALYEGVPEFLDSIQSGLSELAVYSSLYMALVSTMGFTESRPADHLVVFIMNGVYASMFLHSSVVLMVVFHRVGAISHLRDSDKLLFLWRGRYLPLLCTLFFCWGTISAMATLMFRVTDMVWDGNGCIPDQPRMRWYQWYDEWAEYETGVPVSKINLRRVGQGIIHPKGEIVQNPWVRCRVFSGFWCPMLTLFCPPPQIR